MKKHASVSAMLLAALAGIGQGLGFADKYHSTPQFRGSTPPRRHRGAKNRKSGFGASLKTHYDRQRAALSKASYPSDEHGAYTVTGRAQASPANPLGARRKWLAGISAQRGY